jgi:hypothetical protein
MNINGIFLYTGLPTPISILVSKFQASVVIAAKKQLLKEEEEEVKKNTAIQVIAGIL